MHGPTPVTLVQSQHHQLHGCRAAHRLRGVVTLGLCVITRARWALSSIMWPLFLDVHCHPSWQVSLCCVAFPQPDRTNLLHMVAQILQVLGLLWLASVFNLLLLFSRHSDQCYLSTAYSQGQVEWTCVHFMGHILLTPFWSWGSSKSRPLQVSIASPVLLHWFLIFFSF